jgi:hypothetical protein
MSTASKSLREFARDLNQMLSLASAKQPFRNAPSFRHSTGRLTLFFEGSWLQLTAVDMVGEASLTFGQLPPCNHDLAILRFIFYYGFLPRLRLRYPSEGNCARSLPVRPGKRPFMPPASAIESESAGEALR